MQQLLNALKMAAQTSPITVQLVSVVVFSFCAVTQSATALSANDEVITEQFLDALQPKQLDALLVGRSVLDGFGLNQSCLEPENNYRNLKQCLQNQCVGAEDVAGLYSVETDSALSISQLQRLAPAVLYTLLQSDTCPSRAGDTPHDKPGSGAVWGYSFLFVTVINLCSLAGALVLPCMKMRIYQLVLMFMVALAVGTLVGSGLLVLIPEALGMPEEEDAGNLYIWKLTTVMGGIYLFFLTERVMRMINAWRENKRGIRNREQAHVTGTSCHDAPENPLTRLKDTSRLPLGETTSPCALVSYTSEPKSKAGVLNDGFNSLEEVGAADGDTAGNANTRETNGHPPTASRHQGHEHRVVAPVAYMIVFGDALHNFIDGLSIGAAFTDNTLLGVSVSVAVLCEELPHELGDFAILLNSGMRLRKAVLYNFLSSLSCYVGLVIGILLGENTSANTWIFAIAGGMFLYISLVDMMPEMNSAVETEEAKAFGEKKTFLLQNVGLVLGFGIILLLALYGGEINFE